MASKLAPTITIKVAADASVSNQQTLAMLALAGLATVVTETLRVNGGTFTIERPRCATEFTESYSA